MAIDDKQDGINSNLEIAYGALFNTTIKLSCELVKLSSKWSELE